MIFLSTKVATDLTTIQTLYTACAADVSTKLSTETTTLMDVFIACSPAPAA